MTVKDLTRYLGNVYNIDSCSKTTCGEWKLAKNITSLPAQSFTESIKMLGQPSGNSSHVILLRNSTPRVAISCELLLKVDLAIRSAREQVDLWQKRRTGLEERSAHDMVFSTRNSRYCLGLRGLVQYRLRAVSSAKYETIRGDPTSCIIRY